MGANFRIEKVREILRKTPDGLTISELSEKAGTDGSHISRILKKMPDAYIDRWKPSPLKKNTFCSVWCVVIPPENCPRPVKRK